jgi:hypothetical protein
MSWHATAGLAPPWPSRPGDPRAFEQPAAPEESAANQTLPPDSVLPADEAAASGTSRPFDVMMHADGSVAIRYGPLVDKLPDKSAETEPRAVAAQPPIGPQGMVEAMGASHPEAAASSAVWPHSVVPRRRNEPRSGIAWAFTGGVVVATVLIITGYQLSRARMVVPPLPPAASEEKPRVVLPARPVAAPNATAHTTFQPPPVSTSLAPAEPERAGAMTRGLAIAPPVPAATPAVPPQASPAPAATKSAMAPVPQQPAQAKPPQPPAQVKPPPPPVQAKPPAEPAAPLGECTAALVALGLCNASK